MNKGNRQFEQKLRILQLQSSTSYLKQGTKDVEIIKMYELPLENHSKFTHSSIRHEKLTFNIRVMSRENDLMAIDYCQMNKGRRGRSSSIVAEVRRQ